MHNWLHMQYIPRKQWLVIVVLLAGVSAVIIYSNLKIQIRISFDRGKLEHQGGPLPTLDDPCSGLNYNVHSSANDVT